MAETREIAEIKDKFTGDVNELRDKKVATATDASSAADVTSNLKFLLLNGTNGEFETALKSYVDEAVRQALGTLVSGLDKGTGASKILATDSSNDLGTITPANLANVLSNIRDSFYQKGQINIVVDEVDTYTAYSLGVNGDIGNLISIRVKRSDGNIGCIQFWVRYDGGSYAMRSYANQSWTSWHQF